MELNFRQIIVRLVLWLLISIPQLLSAQSDTTWYDEGWRKLDDNTFAYYYRPAPKKVSTGYRITDYYISGTKQMEGISLNATIENWVGKVVWYYPNTKPSEIKYYSKPNVVDKEEQYYQNGQLKCTMKYVNNELSGSYLAYHTNGKKAEEGQFSHGVKAGTWKYYDFNGNLVGTIKY